MPTVLVVGASSSLLEKANPEREDSFTKRDVMMSGECTALEWGSGPCRTPVLNRPLLCALHLGPVHDR